jgi:hypothetical protein
MRRPSVHLTLGVWGDFSQTRPLALSSTASFVNVGKMTNRCAAGKALFGF